MKVERRADMVHGKALKRDDVIVSDESYGMDQNKPKNIKEE